MYIVYVYVNMYMYICHWMLERYMMFHFFLLFQAYIRICSVSVHFDSGQFRQFGAPQALSYWLQVDGIFGLDATAKNHGEVTYEARGQGHS